MPAVIRVQATRVFDATCVRSPLLRRHPAPHSSDQSGPDTDTTVCITGVFVVLPVLTRCPSFYQGEQRRDKWLTRNLILVLQHARRGKCSL